MCVVCVCDYVCVCVYCTVLYCIPLLPKQLMFKITRFKNVCRETAIGKVSH